MSWLALLLLSMSVSSPGLSARFRPVRAVEREPIMVAIEVEDPGRAVGAVVVEIETSSRAWARVDARMDEIEGVWHAKFPAARTPAAGREIALRASVLGARGGLLLDLGFDEPLTATVETAQLAETYDRALRQSTQPAGTGALDALVAYVGAEGRIGSGARARVLLAVGIAASERQEITLGVAVGPAFSRPLAVAEGGPIVIGFEAAWRGFAIVPRFTWVAPYVELGAHADLRLPGFDPGLAARAGASIDLGLTTRLDVAFGGGPVIFGAAGAGASEVGFVGGGRLALRFASGSDDADAR